jgi:hypothetical protein
MSDAHLTERQVAGYLDQALGAVERTGVEEHLEQCDACRSELLDAARIADTLPAPRRRWLLAGAAAAAAVIGIVLLMPGRKPAGDVIRGPNDGEGVPHMTAVIPASDARVSAGSLRLVWRAVATAELYRVTVTDAGGAPVWSDSTSDTAATPRATLTPGRTYYWVVDALLSDGRSATTGSVGFTVAP